MDLAGRLQARTSPLDGLPAAHPMLSTPQPWRLAVVHEPAGHEPAGHDALLPLAPGRWLAVQEEPPADPPGGPQPAAGPARLVDVTDGTTRIRVTGAAARALLATAMSVDLRPEAFPPGHSAATAYRTLAVVVHTRDGATFDLYVSRSHAASLWTWLADAAEGLD